MATRPPVVTFSLGAGHLPCGCHRFEGVDVYCTEHARILELQASATEEGMRQELTRIREEIDDLATRLAEARAQRQRLVIAARWAQALTAEEIADRAGYRDNTVIARLCRFARMGWPPEAHKKGVR